MPERKVEEIDRLRVSELHAQMATIQNAFVALRIIRDRAQVQIQLTDTQVELQKVEEQRLQTALNRLMTELREKYDFSVDEMIDSKTGEIVSSGQVSQPTLVPEPDA
jgi:ABC-type phosphate transport system auxiliary subunit